MFGRNPIEEARKKQKQYGNDPLVAAIAKYNEKAESCYIDFESACKLCMQCTDSAILQNVSAFAK